MANKSAIQFRRAIEASGNTIYSTIVVGDPDLWIPTPQLEALLNEGLIGISLSGYAIRTRSKVVKTAVCCALGYPVPDSFKKTQPRLFGQQLDVYVQKARNLQIWNQELSATRRYAIVQVSESDLIVSVKVVNGQELAMLDTTGTITKKYQARLLVNGLPSELISLSDTAELMPYVNNTAAISPDTNPTSEPESSTLLPIKEIFQRLLPLLGQSFPDPGIDQERNRGAGLHKIVCGALGYKQHGDTGQFPDIRNQLLELKLQTSTTIDLGLVSPDGEEVLDVTMLGNFQPRHRDTRYALFFAKTDGVMVTITNIYLTTGADFFSRFRRFEGKVTNGKIQIPLPRDFFGP